MYVSHGIFAISTYQNPVVWLFRASSLHFLTISAFNDNLMSQMQQRPDGQVCKTVKNADGAAYRRTGALTQILL